jgi:hypothetical protein
VRPPRRGTTCRPRSSSSAAGYRACPAAEEIVARLRPEGKTSRRLRAHLVQLTEAALLVDAQLALPGSLNGDRAAERLRRQLLDVELRLTGIARYAQAMAHLDLPGGQAVLVRQALQCLAGSDYPGAAAAALNLRQLLAGLAANGSMWTSWWCTASPAR